MAKESQEKDCNSESHPSYTKASKKILGHRWFLQALDTWVFDVDERAGVTKGVLTQTLGPWKRPVVCLSKKLDPVASRWFSCLKAIAAIALLVKDADKLTLGQQITVVASHTLESITNAPVTHQSFLLSK